MVWKFILCGMIILTVTGVNIWGMMHLDPEQNMQMTGQNWLVFIGSGLVMTQLWMKTVEGFTLLEQMAWMIVCIYFLSCTMTDIMSCYVYDWFQIWGTAAGIYLIIQTSGEIWIGCSIVLYVILQGALFMKLYGKADGLAFLVAALVLGSMGLGVRTYLLHMIISYLLLASIQFCKGNIGKKGNLKKPVPFLPYIMISFWIVVKTQIF